MHESCELEHALVRVQPVDGHVTQSAGRSHNHSQRWPAVVEAEATGGKTYRSRLSWDPMKARAAATRLPSAPDAAAEMCAVQNATIIQVCDVNKISLTSQIMFGDVMKIDRVKDTEVQRIRLLEVHFLESSISLRASFP